MRSLTLFLSALCLFSASRNGYAQITGDGPCGIPPPPKPKRIKGGEGFPPLPLPVTPLRRTERKRNPAPPVLIGKVVWGKKRVKVLKDGRKIRYADWNLDPNTDRILRIARKRMGIRYRMQPVRLEGFSFDPERIPILYVTGVRAVSFSPEIRKKLRTYCLRGGFLLGDACRGSRVFAKAFRKELNALFPEKKLRALPPDHPLFSAYRKVDKVKYSPAVDDRPNGMPYLEGINLGCRTVAVLSKYGLCCAWDSNHVVPGSRIVVGEDAYILGLNLISYVLGTFELGRFYASGGLKEPASANANGDFLFAQLLHEGLPDPDPTAFARLLEYVTANTSVGLRFERKLLKPEDPHLSSYPFLYITGHYGFRLSKEAVKRLRRHLENGGFLLADACCGRLSFDRAFRREIKKVLPQATLKRLPRNHPIMDIHYDIREAKLTPKAKAAFPSLVSPHLEGIEINGSLRVVYSFLDLGNGWEGVPHPYARGHENEYALKIGVNAIIFALSH